MSFLHAKSMSEEELSLFIVWEQTDEHRAAIHAALHGDPLAVKAQAERAREVTINQRAPSMSSCPTVHVLFPAWGFEETPMQDAFAAMEAA